MRTPGRGGFSLLELMVILSILGLSIAVSVPGMRGYMRTQRTTGAAVKLAANCDLARSMAICRGNPVEVFINMGANEFWVLDDTNENGVKDAGETVLGPHELPSGVYFVGVTLTGDGRLVFQPSGTLNPGQSAVIILADSTASDTVEVFSSGTISR